MDKHRGQQGQEKTLEQVQSIFKHTVSLHRWGTSRKGVAENLMALALGHCFKNIPIDISVKTSRARTDQHYLLKLYQDFKA